MRTRSSATHLAAQAEDTFEEVVRALGLKPRSAKRDEPFDFSVSVPGGTPISVEVKAMALPTADRIGVLKRDRSRADLVVVVADQVPAPARAALDAAGLGWLDRRGHLRMVGHGLFIDTDLAPEPRRGTENGAARRPIAGRAGLASATALLLDPDQPVGVSDTARIAGLNPSSITRARRLERRQPRRARRPRSVSAARARVVLGARRRVAARAHRRTVVHRSSGSR